MLFATPRRQAAAVVLIVMCIPVALLWGCSRGSGSSGNSVTPPTPLSITSTSLSDGQINTAYNATLAATGGTAPYTWSLTAGTLPAGLSLNASGGVISGMPTATASGTALTFKVSDSGSPAQRRRANLSLVIVASLRISTTSLPNGQVGSAYSATLTATGGALPLSWTLTAGTLPAGLALDASTGALSW